MVKEEKQRKEKQERNESEIFFMFQANPNTVQELTQLYSQVHSLHSNQQFVIQVF
jgi:uncharacterized protein YegL